MITTKKELKFYIAADRVMNGLSPSSTLMEKIRGALVYDAKYKSVEYLRILRHVEYYSKSRSVIGKVLYIYYRRLYNIAEYKYSMKIGINTCGYGLVIPHFGCIRIGTPNSIGNYAVLHFGCLIAASDSVIGNGFYMSSGARITSKITLGDFVTVGANSVVNKSFGNNCLLAGIPAGIKREGYRQWYERDGKTFKSRVEKVELLRKALLD